MIENQTQIAVTPSAESTPLLPLQPWVSPSFERIPLNEAMGPLITHIASDGPNTYS
jgi:hypothetical protein